MLEAQHRIRAVRLKFEEKFCADPLVLVVRAMCDTTLMHALFLLKLQDLHVRPDIVVEPKPADCPNSWLSADMLRPLASKPVFAR